MDLATRKQCQDKLEDLRKRALELSWPEISQQMYEAGRLGSLEERRDALDDLLLVSLLKISSASTSMVWLYLSVAKESL